MQANNRFFIGMVAMAAMTALSGCCGKKTSGEVGKTQIPVDANTEIIEAYIDTQNEYVPFDEGTDAYFDFSDGVEYAYKMDVNKGYLHDIVNKLNVGDNFYSLANNKIEPIEGDKESIYNKILNPSSYRNHAAPIRAALDSIVKGNKRALLVTDFEEFDGTVHKSAYAKEAFTEWLKKGNDITFFIMDYKEKGKDKKIYFTIFDGKDHKLLNDVKSAIGGGSDADYTEFTLANNNITFVTTYPGNGTKGGNFHDDSMEDPVSYVTEDPNSPNHYFMSKTSFSEFYPIEGPSGYQEICATAFDEAYQDKSRPFPPYTFTHFLRNLYADLSKLPYNDVQLDIKVYNAEQDLANFNDYLVALEEKPEEMGITDNPYWDENLNIRPEWDYRPGARLPEIVDMFVFDNNPAVNPNVEVPAGKEIAIAFADAYDGEMKCQEISDDHSLIRIDVIIKSVADKTKDELEPLFKWGNNDNLSESVRLALQEVRPTGNTIYTYYVKLY